MGTIKLFLFIFTLLFCSCLNKNNEKSKQIKEKVCNCTGSYEKRISNLLLNNDLLIICGLIPMSNINNNIYSGINIYSCSKKRYLYILEQDIYYSVKIKKDTIFFTETHELFRNEKDIKNIEVFERKLYREKDTIILENTVLYRNITINEELIQNMTDTYKSFNINKLSEENQNQDFIKFINLLFTLALNNDKDAENRLLYFEKYYGEVLGALDEILTEEQSLYKRYKILDKQKVMI